MGLKWDIVIEKYIEEDLIEYLKNLNKNYFYYIKIKEIIFKWK